MITFLWTSGGREGHYPPAADAPAEQHFAYVALTAMGLACTATGSDPGEPYRNALLAYERKWATTTDRREQP